MEEGKSSSSLSTNNNSARWNPTKEQISMLENLYKQGVRTPTAEQIQHITGKLREFGNIEGKNVFYWFQNHKARQRQKQKQQTFAYYTKLLKRSPHQVLAPVAPMPPPQPNAVVPPPVACNGVVVFRPMYATPQTGALNFYPQAQDQAQYSAMFSPESSKMTVFPSYNILPPTKYAHSNNECIRNHASVSNPEVGGAVGLETLQLFPLHPANKRSHQDRLGSSLTSDSAELSERAVEEEGGGEVGGASEHQYLVDFLGALKG